MKIGIVCDNFKLPFFEKELSAKGFEYEFTPFTDKTTSLSIHTTKDKVSIIHQICKQVEIDSKRGN